MPVVEYEQGDFTAGILHGSAASLEKLSQYRNGLLECTNMNITTAGALRVKDTFVEVGRFDVHAIGYNDINDILDNNFYVVEGTQGKLFAMVSALTENNVDLSENQPLVLNITDSTLRVPFINIGSAADWTPLHTYIQNDLVIYCLKGSNPYHILLRQDNQGIKGFLKFKMILDYTVADDNDIHQPYEYELTGTAAIPWGTEDYPQATIIFSDRMYFAVGSTLYGSAIGRYLEGDDKNEVVFRRPAEPGEVVQHKPDDDTPAEALTITIDNIAAGLPTDMVETTISGRSNTHIFDLQSQYGLYAFTEGGVFYTPDAIIKPGEFTMQSVTDTPLKNVHPARLNDSFTFIRQSTGSPEAVIDFRQIGQGQSFGFEENTLSDLVDGLITDTIAMATTRGTDADTINVIYFLQSDGRTIYCLHISRQQQVFGWTKWELADDEPRLRSIAGFENRLFGVDREGVVYECNGSNAKVNWLLTTLRPALQAGNQYSSYTLKSSGWRIVRAMIDVRNCNTSLFVNDREVSPRRLGSDGSPVDTILETTVQGVNRRHDQIRQHGITIRGTGGGDMRIDRIDLKIGY